MTEPGTSNGPDPCHGSNKCLEYHDPMGALPENPTARYNCCCCDPCNYVRANSGSAGVGIKGDIMVFGCCRCVPRGFLLIFTPDDPDDACCDVTATPVFLQFSGEGSEGYWPRYIGSFSDVEITITIEREFASEDLPLMPSVNDRCFWHTVIARDSYVISDQEVDIDHTSVTCLQVPGIDPVAVTDWRGCEGTLTLRNYTRAKIPYLRRQIDTCTPDPCSAYEMADIRCLKVEGDPWWIGGEESGQPYFLNSDGTMKLHWNGSQWLVTVIATSAVYASGPTDDCPLGSDWSKTSDPDALFCVLRCTEGSFIDLYLQEPCATGEVASLTCIAVQGILWNQDGTHGGYPRFESPDGDYEAIYDSTGTVWQIRDTVYTEVVATHLETGDCPFGRYDDNRCVSRCTSLDQTCGQCSKVCSVLTVDGVLRLTMDPKRAEFVWFDPVWDDYNDRWIRGWEWVDTEDGDRLYRIYLQENEEGTCTLVTDFEDDDEIYDPWPINTTRGCSCGLKELIWAVVGLDGMSFTIRCGYKQCWEFACGTCRCVPKDFCALIVHGDSITEEVLTWDPVHFCWGDDYSSVKVCLGRDPDDFEQGCQLTLDPQGFAFTHESALEPQGYPCTTELDTSKLFDPTYDFMSFIFTDGANAFSVFLVGPSENCFYFPCAATVCNTDCGGDPHCLTVTFRWWTTADDMSYPPDLDNVFDISFEVNIHYYQYLYTIVDGIPVFRCSYVGYNGLPVQNVLCGQPGYWVVKYGADIACGSGVSIQLGLSGQPQVGPFDSGGVVACVDPVVTGCDPLIAYIEYHEGQPVDNGDMRGLLHCIEKRPDGLDYYAYHASVTISECA